MPTKDIGGGFEIIDVEKSSGSPIDSQLKVGQLAKLINDQKLAPIELETKEYDLKNKKAEFDRQGLQDKYLQAQLESKQNDEQRSQAKFIQDSIPAFLKLLDQDPQLGKFAIEASIPGSTIKQQPNGLTTLSLMTKDGLKEIPVIPKYAQLTSEQVIGIENQYRDEYVKGAADYNEIFRQYTTMQEYSGKNNGAADLALTFAYSKAQDPRSNVMPGERMTVENIPNIDQKIRNLYNKNTNNDAAFLDPATRKMMTDTVKIKMDQFRKNAIATGMSYKHLADGSNGRINPAAVLVNQGDITLADYYPEMIAKAPPPVQTQQSSLNATPVIPQNPYALPKGRPLEASVLPKRQAGQKAPPIPQGIDWDAYSADKLLGR